MQPGTRPKRMIGCRPVPDPWHITPTGSYPSCPWYSLVATPNVSPWLPLMSEMNEDLSVDTLGWDSNRQGGSLESADVAAVDTGPVRLRVLVVSSAVPQLDQLAIGLARRQLLSMLVHPFLVLDPRIYHLVARIPVVGSRTARELRRRARAGALSQRQVVLAGTRWELLRAGLDRVPRRVAGLFPFQLVLANLWAISRRNHGLANEAARRISLVDVAIVATGTGLPAFRQAPARVLRCLDYPTANWDIAREMLSEEVRLKPDFAGTIQGISIPARTRALQHQEIDAADVILIGSEFARQTFIGAGIAPGRILVAPYGVDTELFTPGPDRDTSANPFTAIFVGSIGQGKGISYLLDAWEAFSNSSGGKTARLVLVGSFVGDPAPVPKRAALIEYLPHRPRTELPAIYRAASVLILPSILEGLGLVVLEAMASGVPCIVTPNGPGEVVRDGVDGFVVPIRDSGAIADRLGRLAQDPELLQCMSHSARARALEYTWDTYTDRVLDGLRARLGGRDI